MSASLAVTYEVLGYLLFVCLYSTIASLQCSLSESNEALVQLKERAKEEQAKASNYEAQVTCLSSELESLREKLHSKVNLLCDFIVQ